ncbi:MAG: ABC-2 family transporter protein [Chloroflexota bacterium]
MQIVGLTHRVLRKALAQYMEAPPGLTEQVRRASTPGTESRVLAWHDDQSYRLALNAMLTFGIYPITLFDNYAKLILFTLIPAALMGAVPAEFIRAFSWRSLVELLGGALILLFIAAAVFRVGLKRYESGSAIQVEV